MRHLVRIVGGWPFPAFLLAALATGTALLVAMLVVPFEATPLADFAADFRTWCFGWDPETGRIEWGYVVTAILGPLVLGTTTVVFWGEPLAEAWRHHRRALGATAASGALLVVAVAAGMGVLRPGVAAGELPFPAEALRTSTDAPSFALVDHTGARVSLEELRGRVVVLTGVYATCGFTCPMILGQAKRALAALTPAERADVVVVGISLDPDHDTPPVLAAMAQGQGVSAPQFRLATGDARTVNALLEALGVSRRRDPDTGVIDHANLFVLVDRSGRVAYRFTLGDRQERWLVQALRLLLQESGTGRRPTS